MKFFDLKRAHFEEDASIEHWQVDDFVYWITNKFVEIQTETLFFIRIASIFHLVRDTNLYFSSVLKVGIT